MTSRATCIMVMAILSLAACRGRPVPAPVPEAAVPAAPAAPAVAPSRPVVILHPDTALLRIHALGRRYGDTRAEIERRAPRCAARGEVTANRHGAGIDSLFTIRCEGVRFVIRLAGNEERREFLETTVLDRELAGATLPSGIRIGRTSAREMKQRLGTPRSEVRNGATTTLTYQVPAEGAEEFVSFHLVRGVLRRVNWIFYVD